MPLWKQCHCGNNAIVETMNIKGWLQSHNKILSLSYQFLTIIQKKEILYFYDGLRCPAWSVPIYLIWYSATFPFTYWILIIWLSFSFSNMPSFFLLKGSSCPFDPNMTFLLDFWKSASSLSTYYSFILILLPLLTVCYLVLSS